MQIVQLSHIMDIVVHRYSYMYAQEATPAIVYPFNIVLNLNLNRCKPGVLYVGHSQTVRTQIRVSTICLQYILLKLEYN